MALEQITLRDFRCFHEKQTARLAPLTLLVGENSTGKTSFLALARALWDVAYDGVIPDFKEAPYDLGSFVEIAHHRGARGSQADQFEAGFAVADGGEPDPLGFSFHTVFDKLGTTPMPVRRCLSHQGYSVTVEQAGPDARVEIITPTTTKPLKTKHSWAPRDDALLPLWLATAGSRQPNQKAAKNLSDADYEIIQRLAHISLRGARHRPYASAPVRSTPRRTYDPARPARDPQGDHIPMYLAHVSRTSNGEWQELKGRLEDFGKEAGLFNELRIKSLGKTENQPFQVQVKKGGRRLKGPWRNLIDVGYGVSQALPIVTELVRTDAPPLFLLQQPEVHLHPSAQAALGSLFCHIAKDRQLLVETHSDHLINRVRMDVRDGKGKLSPDDVSLLYFERKELEVEIHSMRFDEDGNLLGAPPGYGRFFMEETNRSLWY